MTGASPKKSGICQRLREVRETVFGQRGRAAFARALELSPSTYIYYEKGRVPPPEVLAKAAEIAGFSLDWLITGREPRQPSPRETSSAAATTLPSHLQAALERFLEQAGSSERSPAAAQAMATLLSSVHNSFPAEDRQAWKIESLKDPAGMIPVLGRTAAGLVGDYKQLLGEEPATTVADIAERALGLDVRRGTTGQVEAGDPTADIGELSESVALVQLGSPLPSGVIEFLDAPQVRQHHPEAFALRVDGESMTPQFRHGDIVIALAGHTPQNGRAALVKIADRVGITLKLVRREGQTVHLIPINETYDTERLPAEEIEWTAPVLLAARFPHR